jgi:hypothetical protein
MKSRGTLSFEIKQVLAGLLLASLLFCQFLGFQHSIHHGMLKFSSVITNQDGLNTIDSKDVAQKVTTDSSYGVEHHCVAWDHATLSFGSVALSCLIPIGFFSFKLLIFSLYSHPSDGLITSYLTRAPPVNQ